MAERCIQLAFISSRHVSTFASKGPFKQASKQALFFVKSSPKSKSVISLALLQKGF